MKLLLVTPYFYPKIGGLENYAYNIAKGLKDKFHWDIIVVTSNHEGKKYIKESLEGLTIYRLAPLFSISNTPINPFWYFEIKKIIKKEKPDIINAHSPVPFIADVARVVSGSIPFVTTYHAGSMKKGTFFYDSIIDFYEKLILPKLLENSNKIICVSEFVKQDIAKKYLSKAIVVTPAVDVSIFKPSAKKRNENTILFVGRHANVYKLKGFYYLQEIYIYLQVH